MAKAQKNASLAFSIKEGKNKNESYDERMREKTYLTFSFQYHFRC